jgi:hypothetical protein
MRSFHNNTKDCTKCLASLQVTFINQGLNVELIQQFITEHMNEDKQQFDLTKITMTADQRIEKQITFIQLSHLLSLLQRIKTQC